MIRALLASLSVAALPPLGSAQQLPEFEGWRMTLGGGGLYSPTYEGDDDYSLSVLPNVQFNYEDTFFASVQDGIGYNLTINEQFKLGPIARVRFSREEDGEQVFAVTGTDTTDLVGLGNIDTGVEVGGFAAYDFGPVDVRAEARQAIGAHEGLVADFSASWSGRIMTGGPPIIWSAGPRMSVVSDEFASAYFGVTPAQAEASGLPVFEAGGGLHSYGVSAVALLPLDRSFEWNLVMIAGYTRLAGDAADGPLVDLRGSPDQATLGLFLSRTFY